MSAPVPPPAPAPTAATPHAGRLATLGALFLTLGLVAGRLEITAMGAAFLVVLAAGLLRPAPRLSANVRLADERIYEDGTTRLTVTVEAATALEIVDVEVLHGAGLEIAGGEPRASIAMVAGERRDLAVVLRPRRWGVHRVGPVLVTAYARGRLTASELVLPELPLRVLPHAERFAATRLPFPRVLSGTHVARAAGEGVELAGVREFVPGDAIRRVNWKVTARRQELHVTEHHPERNAEVVVFLDTFSDPGPAGQTSLDAGVRAALGISEHFLSRMDRVGLVGFGGVMRWLFAGSGRVQLHRAVEHLLGTELVLSYAWKDVALLPPRSLPPRALVIALSPLVDQRAVGALADLARRGHGVVIVDTAPDPIVTPSADPVDRAAVDLFGLERRRYAARLSELGVPVVPWRGAGSLDAVLTEVARLHARPRLVTR